MDITKIADVIKNNDNFAIAVHVNPDGDCLGSASALLLTIRAMGKKAHLVMDGRVPDRFLFLVDDDFFGSMEDNYDICIAIDVADEGMMGSVKENVFDKARITCCIDHHGTNDGYADFNFVDAKASAAGEIVFTFIKNYLKAEITSETAKRIFTAIISDTGVFRYSNTTSNTHRIAAELMQFDFGAAEIVRNLFETKTMNQVKLRGEVTSSMRFYMDNRVCVISVDCALLDKYSLTFDQSDDLAAFPRSIDGVEVGIYLKVKSDSEVKVSLRSNSYVNVAEVAASLGGGGHMRAAGVTIHGSAEYAEKVLIEAIEKVM